jgi:hypothetical protein
VQRFTSAAVITHMIAMLKGRPIRNLMFDNGAK